MTGWNQNLSRTDSVSRVTLAIWLLGMLTTVRSSVRIRVDRRPMWSTVPTTAPIFSGSAAVSHLLRVAHAHRLVDDQRDAGDDVLQRLLRGQRDGDAADAEAGQG